MPAPQVPSFRNLGLQVTPHTQIHSPPSREARGPWGVLPLHTLGWKAFQDLCSQVCEEVLRMPVEIYQEAKDGGQDAVFVSTSKRPDGSLSRATVQCKFSSNPQRTLTASLLTS